MKIVRTYFSELTKNRIKKQHRLTKAKQSYVCSEGLSFSSGAQWTDPVESSRNAKQRKTRRKYVSATTREKILKKFRVNLSTTRFKLIIPEPVDVWPPLAWNVRGLWGRDWVSRQSARGENRWLATYFAGIFTIRWPVRSGSTTLEKLRNFHFCNSTDTARNAKVIPYS